MRKYVYILIALILIGGGIYYLLSIRKNIDIQEKFPFFSYQEKDGAVVNSGTAFSGKEKASSSAAGFFNQSQKTLQNLAQQTTEETKNFLTNAPDMAIKKFSDVIGGIRDTARQGVINVLGISPADNTTGAQVKVCSVQKNGDIVTYLIENTFFPSGGLAYEVVWDDGAAAAGELKSSEQNFLASHLYARNGVYHATFRTTTASSTLITEREICVQ